MAVGKTPQGAVQRDGLTLPWTNAHTYTELNCSAASSLLTFLSSLLTVASALLSTNEKEVKAAKQTTIKL